MQASSYASAEQRTDGPFCFSAVRSRIAAESQLQALALGSLTDIAFSLLSTGSRRQAEMGDGDGCAGHAGASRRVRWQLGQWARELGVQSVLWVVEFRTSRYAVSSKVLAEFFSAGMHAEKIRRASSLSRRRCSPGFAAGYRAKYHHLSHDPACSGVVLRGSHR